MAEIKSSFPAVQVGHPTEVYDRSVGAFAFFRDRQGAIKGLLAMMPYNNEAGRRVARFTFNPDEEHWWQWDGDLQKPTLSPSLHLPGHWHGYLWQGNFVSV